MLVRRGGLHTISVVVVPPGGVCSPPPPSDGVRLYRTMVCAHII